MQRERIQFEGGGGGLVQRDVRRERIRKCYTQKCQQSVHDHFNPRRIFLDSDSHMLYGIFPFPLTVVKSW